MESPPLTPLRQRPPSIYTSPEYQRPDSRRTSSFSSINSPGTRRSSYSYRRSSNASRHSGGMSDFASPRNEGSGGMGNLADELDLADEEWEEGEEEEDEQETSLMEGTEVTFSPETDSTPNGLRLHDPIQTDGARDSGIDVGYKTSPSPSMKLADRSNRKVSAQLRNFSRPLSAQSQPDPEERFSFELEQAMGVIARLANPSNNPHADTTSRTVTALQDLSAQTTIETHTHRLTTSMHSLASQRYEQAKFLQSVSSTLFPAFAFTTPLDELDYDEVSMLLGQLLQQLPIPEPLALQGLTRLNVETTDLVKTLSGLLDTLQMDKQAANSAARHLKVTHVMTTDIRLERERADESRFWIEREGWNEKLGDRWCANECRDVVDGFEKVCDGLRKGLEESAA